MKNKYNYKKIKESTRKIIIEDLQELIIEDDLKDCDIRELINHCYFWHIHYNKHYNDAVDFDYKSNFTLNEFIDVMRERFGLNNDIKNDSYDLEIENSTQEI